MQSCIYQCIVQQKTKPELALPNAAFQVAVQSPPLVFCVEFPSNFWLGYETFRSIYWINPIELQNLISIQVCSCKRKSEEIKREFRQFQTILENLRTPWFKDEDNLGIFNQPKHETNAEALSYFHAVRPCGFWHLVRPTLQRFAQTLQCSKGYIG